MRRHGYNANGEVMSSVFVDQEVNGKYQFYADTGDGVSKVKPEFQDECDINVLMARYEKIGVISHINERPREFYDVSEVPDYREALHMVQRAQDAFMALPARIRSEFDNDPGAYVAFAQDPANIGRMVEWGLADPPPAPEPPAPAVPPMEPPKAP